MSKFQSTISTVAALLSIFGAGAAGFKLAQDGKTVDSQNIQTEYETQITELRKQISNLEQQSVNSNPPPAVSLPEPTVAKQPTPQPPILPPTNPPPSQPPAPPAAGNFE